ncbi:MAG: M23 family metallopeptidase [Bacilli bacterium]|nr:M23 family metallopeptidase [Bacilli bacterium]
MEIDLIKKAIKERRQNVYLEKVKTTLDLNPKTFSFIMKLMILCVMFLSSLIYIKSSTVNKQRFYDMFLKDNLSFAVINNLYNNHLGSVLPFKDIIKNNKPVFKEKLVFSDSSIYKDGVMLNVDESYLVPVLDSGIVVFIGNKEDYGKTVIVQQSNGIDVWYGNIDNLNVKIYDYIEGGSLLGETVDNKLYLVFKKEGKILDYKKYIQ